MRENNKIKISFYNNYFPIENPIDIRYVLYIKDRYLISDKKYQIIRKHFNENLPSLNMIKKLRKQLNDNHHIFHSNFVSNNPAKYVDIKESIKKKLFEYLSSLPEQELNNLGALREDKRKLGIKLCYTLIQSKDCKSPFGNITIMVAEVKEQYGALEEPLELL